MKTARVLAGLLYGAVLVAIPPARRGARVKTVAYRLVKLPHQDCMLFEGAQ